MSDPTIARCFGCLRTPAELPEVVAIAADEGVTPDEWVRTEEGTFNRENGHFACDECYVAIGMPSLPAPARWIAP